MDFNIGAQFNELKHSLKETDLYHYIFNRNGVVAHKDKKPKSAEIVDHTVSIFSNVNKLLVAFRDESKARQILYRQKAIKISNGEKLREKLMEGTTSTVDPAKTSGGTTTGITQKMPFIPSPNPLRTPPDPNMRYRSVDEENEAFDIAKIFPQSPQQHKDK